MCQVYDRGADLEEGIDLHSETVEQPQNQEKDDGFDLDQETHRQDNEA